MKGPVKVGTKATTRINLAPQWGAGRKVVVISWEAFKKGELASDSRYHWSLDEIRNATFIRYLDGPKAGKVDMSDAHYFEATP